MTYNVFGGTLSLTQSINQSPVIVDKKRRYEMKAIGQDIKKSVN